MAGRRIEKRRARGQDTFDHDKGQKSVISGRRPYYQRGQNYYKQFFFKNYF